MTQGGGCSALGFVSRKDSAQKKLARANPEQQGRIQNCRPRQAWPAEGEKVAVWCSNGT